MEKMIFSRKKSTFFLGDGGRFGEEVLLQKSTYFRTRQGTRGGAVALLGGFFRGGDGKGGIFGAVAQVGKSA